MSKQEIKLRNPFLSAQLQSTEYVLDAFSPVDTLLHPLPLLAMATLHFSVICSSSISDSPSAGAPCFSNWLVQTSVILQHNCTTAKLLALFVGYSYHSPICLVVYNRAPVLKLLAMLGDTGHKLSFLFLRQRENKTKNRAAIHYPPLGVFYFGENFDSITLKENTSSLSTADAF